MSDPSIGTQLPSSSAATSPVEVSSSIADPAPLGLAAFAMTTFILSLSNSGWVKGAGTASILALALFYGGAAQLLAGMWEFKNKNTFGALAFTSYGAFWLAFFYYVKYIVPTLTTGGNQATGYFLLAWGIFTLYMLVASLKTNLVVVGVFLALTVTFALLAAGSLDNSTGITHAGGIVGLVTAALAWYGSFAGVTNATWKKSVLPVWPQS